MRSLLKRALKNYMLEGPLAALDAIRSATGEHNVNAIGYCLGGTLLASTAAYSAAKGDDRIASATYFATLVDFTEVGDMAGRGCTAILRSIGQARQLSGRRDPFACKSSCVAG